MPLAAKNPESSLPSFDAGVIDQGSKFCARNSVNLNEFYAVQVAAVRLMVELRAPLFYFLRGEHIAFRNMGGKAYNVKRPTEEEIALELYEDDTLPGLDGAAGGKTLTWNVRRSRLQRHEVVSITRELELWFGADIFNGKTGAEATDELQSWLLQQCSCSVYLCAITRTLKAPQIPPAFLSDFYAAHPPALANALDKLHEMSDRIMAWREIICRENQPLVFRQAQTEHQAFVDNGHGVLDINDVEGFAFEALVDAVDRYDPNTRNTFSTFAFKVISGGIKRGLEDNGGVIRYPNLWLQDRARIQSYRAKNERAGSISVQEICAALEMTTARYCRAMEIKQIRSLDTPVNTRSGANVENGYGPISLHEFVPAADEDCPRNNIEAAELAELVRNVLQETLSPQERLIVSYLSDTDVAPTSIAYVEHLLQLSLDGLRKVSARANAQPSEVMLLTRGS